MPTRPTGLPTTRSELVPLLAARGLRPSRRRGQNFLVDPALAAAIVSDAGVTRDDHVVEIGPGAGALTQPLLAVAGRVTAIELDRGLAALLREHLAQERRLELVEGDALEGPERLHPAITAALDGREFARTLVVANLPYSCGTAVVSGLLRRDVAPDGIVGMLQHEVVERLRARVGGRDYGPLAVLVALRGGIEVLRRVPRDVFYPRPDVASAVFRITPTGASAARAAAALDLARRGFAQRRKRLGRVLRDILSDDELAAADIDPGARAQQVPPENWARLAERLAEHGDAT